MMWMIVVGIVTYVLTGLLRPLFAVQPRPNFQGQLIPSSLGLSFIIVSGIFLSAQRHLPFFALTIAFFGLLGLVDDFYGGAHNSKGFRGHFTTNHFSSGVLKALGGLGIAWAINLNLTNSFGDNIINSLIMALAANFINLLDLRPGRAGKVFLILTLPLALIASAIRNPLLIISGAVLGYLPWDLRGDVMMGDTGSNAIGAVLGLGIILGFERIGKIAVLIVLLSLNLLAERISFSQVIEGNPVLNFLDQLGR